MIEINNLDHNGRGIGRLNEKVVFVENALPGEIVEIRILEEKKNYIEASVSKYIKKSNKRSNVLCPYYNNCGGCNIMHMSYSEALKFKEEKIKNIISKYLNENIKINPIIKSDKEFNYRNKVTFQVNKKLGFYKNNTNDIIEIDKCLNADKIINEALPYIKKLNLDLIKKVICRVNNNKLMIIIEAMKDIDTAKIQGIADSIYLNNKLVYGDEFNYQDLNNYRFVISPDSFFQINNNVCIKLYDKIKSYIKENDTVLDLYCGTGTIGIYTNKNNKTTGIEINKNAIKNAYTNKHINKTHNIDFICNNVSKEINKFNNVDTIIVDPPRSGLDKNTINTILKINPKSIIYVSCDPMTLVRDLKILKDKFDIIEITPFDMFPNTKHVECCSLLRLKELKK